MPLLSMAKARERIAVWLGARAPLTHFPAPDKAHAEGATRA